MLFVLLGVCGRQVRFRRLWWLIWWCDGGRVGFYTLSAAWLRSRWGVTLRVFIAAGIGFAVNRQNVYSITSSMGRCGVSNSAVQG